MGKEKLYIVFRVYSKKERPDENAEPILYGWTWSKNVLEAFLSQRTREKYYVDKVEGELDRLVDGYYNDLDTDNMINFAKLKSTANKDEDIPLFMTANEMREAEKRIQRYFRELCSLSSIKGDGDYVGMFMNLHEYFAEALELIGFRPPEISAMCPSADYRDDPGEIIGITELIDEAYDGATASPSEVYTNNTKLPGLSTLPDIASKMLYSIESFIKVLREDL